MEIVWVIGMLMAFVLGAYVRRPFVLRRGKAEEPDTTEKKPSPAAAEEERERMREHMEGLQNLMDYTGDVKKE